MSGHAACAVRDKIYMFGGRQNRKYLQRTYVFDTGDALSVMLQLFCMGGLQYFSICSYVMWQDRLHYLPSLFWRIFLS